MLGPRMIFKSFPSPLVFLFQYLLLTNLTLPPFSTYDSINALMIIKGNFTHLALHIRRIKRQSTTYHTKIQLKIAKHSRAIHLVYLS